MPASLPITALLAVLVAGAAFAATAFVLWRTRKAAPAHAAIVAELARAHSDTAARVEALVGMLAKGQTQLAQVVNERLDSVSHRLGDSLQKTSDHTADNLQKLNERLAVIDSAQKNITDLASQVTTLQGMLANKQERGAFGQGRMELIIRDGLPKGCYAFQYTLANNLRPDCAVFLPDQRPLIIDAKFPLESITAYREAKSDEERRAAAARVRADVTRHLADIAQKYLIPGETQDLALMFVPSESVYAELHDGFDDVMQKAFRSKVVIVSPSLLMIAVHVIQQIQKDARMRAAAGQIQAEVGKLLDDVVRLHERVLKLQAHFNQANEDLRQIVISAEKAQKRSGRIAEVEFAEEAADALPVQPVRRLEAGE